MSMYAMMFGENANAETILASIGLQKDDFYRYRDCYVDADGTVAVYTRGGGGNRECWGTDQCPSDNEHGANCVETMQATLRKHPGYISDEDDDFDRTYSTFRFQPPNEAALEAYKSGVRGEALWPLLFDALNASGTAR